MPNYTRNYHLPYFVLGEQYSASSDRYRFSVIDNELNALLSFVGDGIISGWVVSEYGGTGNLYIKVSVGMGIISDFVSMTYGDIIVSVNDNASLRIYMKRKDDYNGGFGPFSPSVSVTCSDKDPPVAPEYINIDSFDYNFVSLSWDDIPASESDFYRYGIYRSTNDFSAQILVGYSAKGNYIDDTVTENTTYRYRVSAFDFSENESSPSPQSDAVTTLLDMTAPDPPTYLFGLSSDNAMDLVWVPSSSSSVNKYEIWVQELDNDYNVINIEGVYSVNSDIYNYRVESLSNSVYYNFMLYAVSDNGVHSEEISIKEAPSFNYGPPAVDTIYVDTYKNVQNKFVLSMRIRWTDDVDPYNELDVYRTVVQIVENGDIVSDPIYIYDGDEYLVDLFYSNGSYESIKPLTEYIVVMYNEDVNGNKSDSTVTRIKSGNYISPSPITNLLYRIHNGNVIFNWENNSSYFSHNLIDIARKDLSTGDTSVIVKNYNNGDSSQYIIYFSDLVSRSEYIISISSVDIYGSISSPVSAAYTVSSDPVGNVDAPANISATMNYGAVILTWQEVTSCSPKYYKIWRASADAVSFIASDWSLIATVSADNTCYEDHTLSSDDRFYYFVTTVDVYGRESLNPIDDGFFYYNFVFGYYHVDDSFAPIENFDVIADIHDAILTWTDTGQNFDGYEIWRSIGDQISWIKVGSIPRNNFVYTDENALSVDGEVYYYIIRQYRNDAEVVILPDTSERPPGCVLLSHVVTNNGKITIDNSVAERINGVPEILRKFCSDYLNNHKHAIFGSDDRRIDLNRNVVVDNWGTDDYRVFTTTEQIDGANDYYITIKMYKSNLYNEDFTTTEQLNDFLLLYGIQLPVSSINNIDVTSNSSIVSLLLNSHSDNKDYNSYLKLNINIPFQVNANNKEIIFSSQLINNTIEVECSGLSEVVGNLDTGRLGYLSATQMYSGVVPYKQMDKISHDGRLDEDLVPLQLPMTTVNGYLYNIAQNMLGDVASLGVSVCFYDICDISFHRGIAPITKYHDNDYFEQASVVAATSRGLMSWINNEIVNTFETDSVPHKICYSEYLDTFFAITITSVYRSNDGVTWGQNSGLENVSIIRDIVSGPSGNMYIATNLGVYTLSINNKNNYQTWEPLGYVSPETSDIFAVFYSENESALLSGTENDVLKWNNSESMWESYAGMVIGENVVDFEESEGSIFALTNTCVYRKNNTDLLFDKISTIGCNVARKIVVFKDHIIVTTDAGVVVSKSDYNIYIDVDIEFDIGPVALVPQSTERDLSVTCLSLQGETLYIGLENHLVVSDNWYSSYDFYQQNYIIPSVYIDGDIQTIGYMYYNPNNSIYFDRIISHESIVSVANQYNLYAARYGGWLDERYDTSPSVYLDKETFGDIDGSNAGAVWALESVTFDDFTISDSYVSGANNYINLFNSSVSKLKEADLSGGEDLQSYISNCVDAYYKVYSQVYGRIGFASTLTINGKDYVIFNKWLIPYHLYTNLLENYEIISNIKDVSVSDTEGVIWSNVVNGVFVFTGTSFNKYNVLTVDLPKTTFGKNVIGHNVIDDKMEYVNSGLPYSFADVQQANVIKTGLFLERKFPGEQTSYDECNLPMTSPYLATYYLTDNNRWYDKLNSTVDYEISGGVDEIDLHLLYPTAVHYIEDVSVVLVGHPNGLISVLVSDGSFSSVVLNGDFSEYVKDIVSINDIIYTITNNNIYYSSDNATTWNRVEELFGVSGDFLFLRYLAGVYILGTDNGIYYAYSISDEWRNVLSISGLTYLYSGSYAIAVKDNRTIYYSHNGIMWSKNGTLKDTRINVINNYRGMLLVGTNSGLCYDGTTFSSTYPAVSLIDVKGDLSDSMSLKINDVDVHNSGNKYIACASNGRYYIYNGSSFSEYTTDLKSIHKILYIGNDIWMFYKNKIYIPSLSCISTLVKGVTL